MIKIHAMTRRILLYVASSSALLFSGVALADDATLPGAGFTATRYEALWTKSPFSVATPEDPVSSPDYSLVGLFRMEGVSYANVVDKQSGEHFIVTSDKPARGLTLVSISRGKGGGAATAILKKDSGEAITLQLEESTETAVPMEAPVPTAMQWGGGGNRWSGGAAADGQTPPPIRMRPHLIHLPPAAGAAPAPTTQPAPAPAN